MQTGSEEGTQREPKHNGVHVRVRVRVRVRGGVGPASPLRRSFSNLRFLLLRSSNWRRETPTWGLRFSEPSGSCALRGGRGRG